MNKVDTLITPNDLSAITGASKATVLGWEQSGKYIPQANNNGEMVYRLKDIKDIPAVAEMLDSRWEDELHTKPRRCYTSVELFAGCGGMALGMEQAGFHHKLLNELDAHACATLAKNRPSWPIIPGDVSHIDYTPYLGKIDFLSGGFPCQAFSYAGQKKGFADTRGTLFFQLARAIKEIKPPVFLAENVRGLLTHDEGRTLESIKSIVCDLGYDLIEPKILKAVRYMVPQKRERLFLLGIRQDLSDRVSFSWPSPYHRILTLRDAFFPGVLYKKQVPASLGQQYPQRKKEIMKMVPMGGYWRDLPDDLQREYMQKSYYLGGGKTGMARRLSLDEPSLTLTCAPAQKQTERCHPIETRPLTVREYARIQTFPDNWSFEGNLTAQYKQIGNAVPVNLAAAIGRAVIRLLNTM